MEPESGIAAQQWREVFDSINDGIFIHDLVTGRILDVNRQACDMYGIGYDEFIGLDMADAGTGEPPCSHKEAMEWIRKAAGGVPQLFEWHSRHRDGHLFWVEINMRRSLIGGQERLIVAARDITERKKAEEALRREKLFSEAVVDAIPNNFYMIDDRGYFVRWNKNVARVMGYPPDEFLRLHVLDAIAPEDREHVASRIDEVLAHEGQILDAYGHLITKDGARIPYYVTAMKAVIEGRAYLLGMSMDITGMRRVEEELIRAKESAEQASRAKSMFLAHMSHEIRNFVNGIVAVTQVLLKSELAPEQREYVAMAGSLSGTILSFVRDILDLSRIEARKVTLEPRDFNIRESLGELLKVQARLAEQKGLALSCTFSPQVPEMLCGDEVRLNQVVLNLVGNAIKFTEAGSIDVNVDARPLAEQEIELMVTVADTGCGIPETSCQKVFEPFTRLESSYTKVYESTGLGLAICRDLVGLMGGSMDLRSRPGEGSTFSFTVRLSRSRGLRQNTAAPALPQPKRRLHILIAEDEVINRMVMASFLQDRGHHVTAVANGAQALAALEKEPFDLVLLDIRMPIMNGVEATRRIRENETDSHITIVALTAYAMKEDIDSFLQAGMDDYLIKPVDLCDLEEAVQKHGSALQQENP